MSTEQSVAERTAYSFIVDVAPLFAYQGWILAHSIIRNCGARPDDIYVNVTSEVDDSVVSVFRNLGCNTVRLQRFGDGAYCNKLAQWNNLRETSATHFVFLDTDMIVLDDCRCHLPKDAISAKVVDLDNPKIGVLDEVLSKAGLPAPNQCPVDAMAAPTYVGNCNGGMYSVPRQHADALFQSWRRWALWLLDNSASLREAGKAAHVDQVSFLLALQETQLPFQPASSNVNYYIHFAGPHACFDSTKPIAILHYHNGSINEIGLLAPQGAATAIEKAAIAAANDLISRNFNNKLFWDLRYAYFPERGSGVGSRGQSLEYKRQLLRDQGAEQAQSVLDVGCGDLEVIKPLALRGYVGVDHSLTTLEAAKRVRPDWTFAAAPALDAPESELVLCFDVLIHQETAENYHKIIDYLVRKARRTLIVSGYEENTSAIQHNHMLFFYEPLGVSLARAGKFSSIRKIGVFRDVVVLRCDVDEAQDARALAASELAALH